MISTKPWGTGPNNLDLDRYCNLLALDLESTMTYSNHGRHSFFHKPEPSLLDVDATIGDQQERLILVEGSISQAPTSNGIAV